MDQEISVDPSDDGSLEAAKAMERYLSGSATSACAPKNTCTTPRKSGSGIRS